jgi:hypothetical protein
MDQHPIPQNVTGFQFKLIGSMTVKQFGYVAAGVIGAVIVYHLPIPGIIGILIKISLIPILGASGAIIAFVPVDGRPIDVMAGNFLKALFSPNQYVYHKMAKSFSFTTVHLNKPKTQAEMSQKHVDNSQQAQNNLKNRELQKILLQSTQSKIKNAQDAHEAAFLKAFSALPTAPAVTITTAPATPVPPITHIAPVAPVAAASPAPIQQPTAKPNPMPLPTLTQAPQSSPTPEAKTPSPEIMTEKEKVLEKQLEFAKREEAATKDSQQVSILHQRTVDLEQQLSEIHSQKAALEQEIASLKKQLVLQKAPTPTITQTAKKPEADNSNAEAPGTGHVRSIPKEMNKKMGLLVSDTPNVVSGVVKDPRGNVLPNILVEIKDKADNPVRAFKTNALGNFASATPLPPGNYTITLEDPKKQNTFDAIKIEATNQIMLPIEIISYDKREQLRKDLFT